MSLIISFVKNEVLMCQGDVCGHIWRSQCRHLVGWSDYNNPYIAHVEPPSPQGNPEGHFPGSARCTRRTLRWISVTLWG